MADPLVAHDDLELFLTAWYSDALAARPEAICQGVTVVRVEPGPDEPWPEKLLVIRDDGTSDDTFLTGNASIGLSVLAGTKQNPKPAKDLARIVRALASQIPSPDPTNPVAALTGRNGPFMVTESHQPYARVYTALTLRVVARPI